MVSLLPFDYRKKHKAKWYLVKNTTLLIVIVVVVLYFTRFVGENVDADALDSFISSAMVDMDVMDMSFEISNNSNPYVNFTSCNVKYVPWAYRCDFVQKNTDCQGNRYLKLQYCVFQKRLQPLYYILAIGWIYILFYLLGNTAEDYFSPSLIKISEYLKLSPNVAGVTFLAFGNGAPDLSSTIVGVFTGNPGMGVSAPIGSGMFLTTVVLGLVILLSDVKVTRRPFFRDICFYFVAVCWVFYWSISNKAYIWETILCLVLYVVYVIVVVVGRIIYQRIKKNRQAKQASIKLEKQSKKKKRKIVSQAQNDLKDSDLAVELLSKNGLSELNAENAEADEGFGNVIQSDDESDSSDTESDGDWTNGSWRRQPSFHLYDSKVNLLQDVRIENSQEISAKENTDNYDAKYLTRQQSMIYLPKVGLVQRSDSSSQALVLRNYFDEYGEIKDNVIEEEDQEKSHSLKQWIRFIIESIGWYEMKWYQKITFILYEAILIFIRNLTIPKADPKEWNKYFASLIPIFAPLLFLFAIGRTYFIYMIGKVFPLAVLIALIGLFFSIVIFCTTKRSAPPTYQFVSNILFYLVHLLSNNIKYIIDICICSIYHVNSLDICCC
jgi:sodium/potassium/calcium exchanger 6